MECKFRGASLVAQWLRIHLQFRRHGFDLWVRKIPWRRKWLPAPEFLPGRFHVRSLASYSPWGHKKSETTEWLDNNSPKFLPGWMPSKCPEYANDPLPSVFLHPILSALPAAALHHTSVCSTGCLGARTFPGLGGALGPCSPQDCSPHFQPLGKPSTSQYLPCLSL